MREIKFRAWDKDGERWLKPNEDTTCCDYLRLITFDGRILEGRDPVLDCCCKHIDDDIHHQLEDVVLMQYTGLKDKNGKEIYEGDIIKGVFNSHPQNWTVGELSAYGLTFNRLTIKPSPSPYRYCDMRHRDQWEVIGNIYENPELI